MKVLAIGECMAELSPLDQAGAFKLGFAGDTFNTAWYLARIAPEVEVRYLTAVGTDALSDDMVAFTRASGIKDAHIQRIEGHTIGLYLIQLSNGERSFCYWRGQSAAKQLAVDQEALERAISQTDIVYFSGITLAVLDPQSRGILFDALRKGRAAGKTIAFDTNLRPMLWPTPHEMTEATTQAARLSDLVLPSYEDEAEWFKDADPDATLNRYGALGVGQIIVKNSAQAVVYQNGSVRGDITVDPAPHVVDTTAAGDSFNAGFLAAQLGGKPLSASISDGCSLARQVVGYRGALVREAKLR